MEKSYNELAEEFDIKEKSKITKIRIAKKILFFPFRIIPKKIRNYIIQHWKDSNKITLASELCGIVGFIISIVIFFYTMSISNQQNAMEKIARDKEMNSILDKSMFQKISLLKEYRYDNSIYNSIISNIITIEEDFYNIVLLSDFARLESNVTKDMFTNISENISNDKKFIIKIVISYFKNIQNFINKAQEVTELIHITYKDISNSDLFSKSQFGDLLTVHVAINMAARKQKFDRMKNKLDAKLNQLNKELRTNPNEKKLIKITNDFNDFLEKENSLFIITNHIRTDVNFLDYTVTQEILKQINT